VYRLNRAGEDGDDDILIGGTTRYDRNADAAGALVQAWSAALPTATRVSNIRSVGVGPDRFRLNANTVTDDNAVDQFFGGAGNDWFFLRLATEPATSTATERTWWVDV
jgi:hypothetical protein